MSDLFENMEKIKNICCYEFQIIDGGGHSFPCASSLYEPVNNYDSFIIKGF